MLMDIYQIEYMHKKYEQRVKSDLWVRAALRARAERTDTTAYSVGQVFRLIANLATTPWQWSRWLTRHWSGQQDAILSIPMKH